ncbi:MAG: hypothetical protein Q8J97_08530, partial [Flavobacteriaceae bacterium]|nr:hypothetical protein [Flavobacteriaceae bacterium]
VSPAASTFADFVNAIEQQRRSELTAEQRAAAEANPLGALAATEAVLRDGLLDIEQHEWDTTIVRLSAQLKRRVDLVAAETRKRIVLELKRVEFSEEMDRALAEVFADEAQALLLAQVNRDYLLTRLLDGEHNARRGIRGAEHAERSELIEWRQHETALFALQRECLLSFHAVIAEAERVEFLQLLHAKHADIQRSGQRMSLQFEEHRRRELLVEHFTAGTAAIAADFELTARETVARSALVRVWVSTHELLIKAVRLSLRHCEMMESTLANVSAMFDGEQRLVQGKTAADRAQLQLLTADEPAARAAVEAEIRTQHAAGLVSSALQIVSFVGASLLTKHFLGAFEVAIDALAATERNLR